MSELSHVVDGLVAMNEPQLLAAFVACGAYALAQSALLELRARTLSWLVAASAALIFVLQSSEWPQATMLCVFAVAGLGAFAAVAWLSSRWLGVAQTGPDTATPQARAAVREQAPAVAPPISAPAAVNALPAPRIRVRRKAYPG